MSRSLRRVLLVGAFVTRAALAQSVPVVTPLLGHDTNSFDNFGSHAALAMDVVVVSAPGRVLQAGGPYGAVYVFRDTGSGPVRGWTEEAVLTHAPGNGVGAVAHSELAGGEIVAMGVPAIGVPNPGPYPNGWGLGAVYIFRHTGTGPMGGWAEEAALQPAGVGDLDQTGSAVALAPVGTGGAVALAAYSRSDVVLFERTAGADGAGTWLQVARFPVRFAVGSGIPHLLSGAPSPNGAFFATSSSTGPFVLRRSPAGAWSRQATLVRTAPNPEEGFGDGTAVLGAAEARGGPAVGADLALVGTARSGNTLGGTAYVFRYDAAVGAWVEEAALRPAVPHINFGRACALDVDAQGRAVAIVLSAGRSLGAGSTAHLFRRDRAGAWSEIAAVNLPANGAEGAVWGSWGGRAVASSSVYESNGRESGGAWVLDFRPTLVTAGDAAPEADAFALSAPAPNPTRGTARLTLVLPEASHVVVRVFSVLGQEVARPVDGDAPAGTLAVSVATGALAAGVYVVRAEATVGGRAAVETRRVTVVR